VKALPNLLSALRIALAPFIFSFLWVGNYGWALILFAAAAVTDWMDGFFARRFGGQSRVGAVLDPVADKILLSGTYLTLALSGGMPAWIAWIVLGRDVLILGTASLLLAFTRERRSFPPSTWGKISTGFQIGFVFAVLLDVRSAAQVLLWVVAIVTIWSGIDYARRVFRASID
jgi:CDP-diacylglycerol--glycerol-3-phosphate 3-phosphatidyltransferase